MTRVSVKENTGKIMYIVNFITAGTWETETLRHCMASSLTKDFSSAWRTVDTLELPPVMNAMTFLDFREIPKAERASGTWKLPKNTGFV